MLAVDTGSQARQIQGVVGAPETFDIWWMGWHLAS